jgi:hypothetical protein
MTAMLNVWDRFTEIVAAIAEMAVIAVAVLMAVAVPAYVIVHIVVAIAHGAIPV